LIPEAPINFDWNSFAPVAWAGTAPFQNASKTVNGWQFTGLTDALKSTDDTSFAGGVKQDVNCASIIGSSVPNKDDLKRIYIAHKTVTINGTPHIFLTLAWERIPLNTVSSSAHVGFEFNQGTSGVCPAGSDGLVNRTPGDLLFVYDFTGGSAGVATLSLRKWILTGSCDIKTDVAPCWGIATDLTASGFAEAAVDSASFPVSDTVAPTPDSLGQSEFGEAGADLTAAGVFSANTCLSLGKVYGVSRSSGNSGQAAMEDLVGPGNIRISNCGTVNVIKHTNPRGINQNFSYSTNIPSGSATGAATFCKTADTTGITTTFTLNDSAGVDTPCVSANYEGITNVHAGSYTVTEGAEPSGFVFQGLSVTTSGGASGAQDGVIPTQADITVVPDSVVTATYTNQAQGEIKIIKQTVPSGSSTSFGYSTSGGLSPSTFNLTGQVGSNTQDYTGVAPGTYAVTETVTGGWSLKDLSCTASGAGSNGSQDGTTNTQADITLAAGGLVTCTYTNHQLGEIKIIKHTDPRGLNQAFNYTANLAGSCTQSTASSFSLNDTGNTTLNSAGNTQDCTNVPEGTYNITETAEPANFSFESLSCTTGGVQDGSNAAKADITLAAGGLVTCTYTNQGLGAIKITKTSIKGTALAGATFVITGTNGLPISASPVTTGNDGTVCVDHLPFGTTYSVQETAAPTGYSIDDSTAHSVTVNKVSGCGDGNEATFSATDTPLTNLTITATSQAAGGTRTSITCTGPSPSTSNIGNSPVGVPTPVDPANVSANGLKPGTYTCTVVVDP
jgi:hypothetical protein